MGFLALSPASSGVISVLSIFSLVHTAAVYAIPEAEAVFAHGASNPYSQGSLARRNFHPSKYRGPALLEGEYCLEDGLPQEKTNGASRWGTWRAPQYPHFIDGPGIPLPHGFPWGDKNCTGTNPYLDPPNTGITKHFDFTISNMTLAPDGVEKNVLVVNGQIPGPPIHANWGDTIEVTVHNELETEGTSVHWHGLLQRQTPFMDGVPGVSQCPIAPRSSFTYRFKADLYGTSWYHSHYSAQYSAGIFGPMIIHGPNHVYYDKDLGPVVLSDWYHTNYYDLVEQVMASNPAPPRSDNNLINGKMNYNCSSSNGSCTSNAGVSKFFFETGKTHRLRLINAGSEGVQQFTVDEHKMTIIANDFVPVQPYTADVVTLGVGQRTDILVNATGQPNGAYWMRSTLGEDPSCSANGGINQGVAAIYYPQANSTAVPTTTSSATLPAQCKNDDLSKTIPVKAITPGIPSSNATDIEISFKSNGTGNGTASGAANGTSHTSFLWYINGRTFRDDYNDPTLLDAKLGNINFSPDRNVYNFGENSTVRLIVRNTFSGASHPMHMHGHNFYVLAEGYGTWDGSITNGNNPQRRDTQLLPPAAADGTPSYMVIQFDLYNPGVWPFHCHIAWHISAGLYINILERPPDITERGIPYVMAQTCRDWTAFTGDHMPDQIDSGL